MLLARTASRWVLNRTLDGFYSRKLQNKRQRFSSHHLTTDGRPFSQVFSQVMWRQLFAFSSSSCFFTYFYHLNLKVHLSLQNLGLVGWVGWGWGFVVSFAAFHGAGCYCKSINQSDFVRPLVFLPSFFVVVLVAMRLFFILSPPLLLLLFSWPAIHAPTTILPCLPIPSLDHCIFNVAFPIFSPIPFFCLDSSIMKIKRSSKCGLQVYFSHTRTETHHKIGISYTLPCSLFLLSVLRFRCISTIHKVLWRRCFVSLDGHYEILLACLSCQPYYCCFSFRSLEIRAHFVVRSSFFFIDFQFFFRFFFVFQ